MRQKDVAGFTSAMVKKELEWQTEEVGWGLLMGLQSRTRNRLVAPAADSW